MQPRRPRCPQSPSWPWWRPRLLCVDNISIHLHHNSVVAEFLSHPRARRGVVGHAAAAIQNVRHVIRVRSQPNARSYDGAEFWLPQNDLIVNSLIQHPVPIRPPTEKARSPALPVRCDAAQESSGTVVMLTTKERKKLRRQRRQLEEQEKRDKIRLGSCLNGAFRRMIALQDCCPRPRPASRCRI